MTSLGERTVEIQAEIAQAQVELAEAERAAEAELQQIAADVVLHVVSETEALKRRAALQADVATRRERLRLLEASLPEIERRRLAEEERARQTAFSKPASRLRVRPLPETARPSTSRVPSPPWRTRPASCSATGRSSRRPSRPRRCCYSVTRSRRSFGTRTGRSRTTFSTS